MLLAQHNRQSQTRMQKRPALLPGARIRCGVALSGDFGAFKRLSADRSRYRFSLRPVAYLPSVPSAWPHNLDFNLGDFANAIFASSGIDSAQLAYRTENLTPMWRKNERLHKLQKSAGIDVSRWPRPIPPKPKWKRWHTYLNLRRSIRAADCDFSSAWVRSHRVAGALR